MLDKIKELIQERQEIKRQRIERQFGEALTDLENALNEGVSLLVFAGAFEADESMITYRGQGLEPREMFLQLHDGCTALNAEDVGDSLSLVGMKPLLQGIYERGQRNGFDDPKEQDFYYRFGQALNLIQE